MGIRRRKKKKGEMEEWRMGGYLADFSVVFPSLKPGIQGY